MKQHQGKQMFPCNPCSDQTPLFLRAYNLSQLIWPLSCCRLTCFRIDLDRIFCCIKPQLQLKHTPHYLLKNNKIYKQHSKYYLCLLQFCSTLTANHSENMDTKLEWQILKTVILKWKYLYLALLFDYFIFLISLGIWWQAISLPQFCMAQGTIFKKIGWILPGVLGNMVFSTDYLLFLCAMWLLVLLELAAAFCITTGTTVQNYFSGCNVL